MTTTPGDLIVLTGPSGVGKSTITEQLHAHLDGPSWLLWQADHCRPRTKPNLQSSTRASAAQLEQRMFAANLPAIAGYLNNAWSVVAELTVMTATEARAVHDIAFERSMIVQLDCSPQTLSSHLRDRDTPVPNSWAFSFYETWREIDLPTAI